ncbi:hypothetical protein GCM10007100_02260 [Roseibacillus persicicus]|uniref:AAA+ ATPase domain-containing protein n=2 Tax=Roseibacillus persicicus TaxID=454148 RepID=A0A918WFJ0_9BACT|nr:hypothetical protein GCM10007100_02260 [Roseibacillus persicicus]
MSASKELTKAEEALARERMEAGIQNGPRLLEATENEENKSALESAFAASLASAPAFLAQEIPERATYLSPFFREGDYGILFAPRGVGKSWLSLLMGKALSEGMGVGQHWEAPLKQKCLYLDSEMNIADLQKRCELLDIRSPQFHVLSHESLFERSNDEITLNLADPSQQIALLGLCETEGVKVLILDNLSTAFRGLNENESDSWERVGPWLLDLRRRGIAVVLVCHAGRNGLIRGTSRREDAAHWIVSLEESGDGDESSHQFKTRFTKCRNCPAADAPPLLWKIDTTGGRAEVTTETYDPKSQMLDMILGGMTSASDIANELGKAKGTISKWAKTLQSDGKIRINNGRYMPA